MFWDLAKNHKLVDHKLVDHACSWGCAKFFGGLGLKSDTTLRSTSKYVSILFIIRFEDVAQESRYQ
jgi:hypothetical protein